MLSDGLTGEMHNMFVINDFRFISSILSDGNRQSLHRIVYRYTLFRFILYFKCCNTCLKKKRCFVNFDNTLNINPTSIVILIKISENRCSIRTTSLDARLDRITILVISAEVKAILNQSEYIDYIQKEWIWYKSLSHSLNVFNTFLQQVNDIDTCIWCVCSVWLTWHYIQSRQSSERNLGWTHHRPPP